MLKVSALFWQNIFLILHLIWFSDKQRLFPCVELTLWNLVITLCTTSCNINKFYILLPTQCMCFVWISEQTAVISPYAVNWLVFKTKTESVYCAKWTVFLNTPCLTFNIVQFPCNYIIFIKNQYQHVELYYFLVS